MIPKKDHAFLQKSEGIQTCYIARLFLYILAALCGHHLKDFTLLSSFSDAFFLRDIQRLMKCIATFLCDNGAIVLLFSVSVIS